MKKKRKQLTKEEFKAEIDRLRDKYSTLEAAARDVMQYIDRYNVHPTSLLDVLRKALEAKP